MNDPRVILLAAHYQRVWGTDPRSIDFQRGRRADLPTDFRVLAFAPTAARLTWRYATCLMSDHADQALLEIHMHSPTPSDEIVELLFAVTHFHRTAQRLGLGHTVNFGRPWMIGSHCDHGLLTLPYTEGPSLEWCRTPHSAPTRCLWLVPITSTEREFKRTHGYAELEQRFEDSGLDFADPYRPSVALS